MKTLPLSRSITPTPFGTLLETCRDFTFRPHDIGARIDERRHYELPLDRDFPFCVTLFHFQSSHYTPGWNWHEYLELFLPLDGPIRMRMGEDTAELQPGDLLVVDNLKLHNVENSKPFDTRTIVISFLPTLVYTPGSPACDYTFLLPFFSKRGGKPYIVTHDDPAAPQIYSALGELLRRFFSPGNAPHAHCGCKSALLELLYHLVQRFQTTGVLRSEFVQRRHESERLGQLFEYVRLNYTEKISVAQAAKLVHMSETQFMKAFRRVAGMTFVTYVTRVRLAFALRLLRETNLTIADIATATGFPDQSYFDRRFKQSYGKSPRAFRAQLS